MQIPQKEKFKWYSDEIFTVLTHFSLSGKDIASLVTFYVPYHRMSGKTDLHLFLVQSYYFTIAWLFNT